MDNPETQFWGEAIVIEPRFVSEIISGTQRDGLRVGGNKLMFRRCEDDWRCILPDFSQTWLESDANGTRLMTRRKANGVWEPMWIRNIPYATSATHFEIWLQHREEFLEFHFQAKRAHHEKFCCN